MPTTCNVFPFEHICGPAELLREGWREDRADETASRKCIKTALLFLYVQIKIVSQYEELKTFTNTVAGYFPAEDSDQTKAAAEPLDPVPVAQIADFA